MDGKRAMKAGTGIGRRSFGIWSEGIAISRVALLAVAMLAAGACANRGPAAPPPSPVPRAKINAKPDAKQLKEAAVYNLQLAVDYYQHGDLAEAKERLDRSLGQDPQSSNAQAFAGLLYERLGEGKKADEHF